MASTSNSSDVVIKNDNEGIVIDTENIPVQGSPKGEALVTNPNRPPSLKVIDAIACPFCQDKIFEHSRKDSKRCWFKALNSVMGAQKFFDQMRPEFNRLVFELQAFKKKFGEIEMEELDKLVKECADEYDKNSQKPTESAPIPEPVVPEAGHE